MILVLTAAFALFSCTTEAKPNTQPSGQPRFQVLTDQDYNFFMTNPKIPWGNDPFESEPGYLGGVIDQPENYQLGGIVYSSEDPLAIIDGETVRVGDLVGKGRRKVKKIGKNYVILSNRFSEMELTLPPFENWVDEGVERGSR